TFVEAPTSAEELAAVTTSLSVPQVANIVFGGKTPELGQTRMKELGFSIVLYANLVLQASIRSANVILEQLSANGGAAGSEQMLATFIERQETVAKPHWDALEERYKSS